MDKTKKRMFYTKLLLLVVTTSCDALIYTSSKKIEDMVLQEENLLHNLHRDLSSLGDGNKLYHFERFYTNRMRLIKIRNGNDQTGMKEYLKHPNGVYHSIKEFAEQYKNIRNVLEAIPSDSVQAKLSSVASDVDLAGARLSFLRLQDVYGLTPSEIIKGNISGFQGPSLDAVDALDIARAGFTARKLEQCEDWLQAIIELKKHEAPRAEFIDNSKPHEADVLSLLGRVYVGLGRKNEAATMYRRSVGLPATSGDVETLKEEININWPTYSQKYDESEGNFSRLCSQQSKLTNNNRNPRLRCSYRIVRPAYNRFKMELLSISPYVAVFHEVITDAEIDHFMEMSKEKMYRGVYHAGGGQNKGTGDFRVSDTGFLSDSESPIIARVGKRVSLITGLNTSQASELKFAGEPFQLVNYGMGGHYGIHMDTFLDSLTEGFHANGNRMATFLIYLTKVERGGSTAFSKLDLVVPPMKRSALFWYSTKPAGKVDFMTFHAGCPVVFGHKWVTNKWMWTHDNMFNRRCGRRRKSTQLAIEKYMFKGWK